MSDRYDQDTILGYVEGELDDAQRASFEAVIADDHELRNLVAQMKLDRQALRSLGKRPAPVGMVDQVIQAQERAALLGEPEVPEPLPMVLPVSRLKLRRVLAYSGVAAVLLLSAALVIPTLMPSGLLDRQSPIAFLDTDAGPTAARQPRNGARALIDEDAAYDQAATRSLARPDAEAGDAAKEVAPETATAMVEDAKTPDVKVAAADTDAVKASPEAPAAALAMAERVKTPGPVSPPRETAAGPTAEARVAKAAADDAAATLTEPVEAQADKPAEKVELAKAEPVNPFAGYADAGADTTITDNSQLLINAASPTLARRDLRDWALANSARVEELDASAGLAGTRARAVTAPVRGLTTTPDASGDTSGGGGQQLTVEIDPAQVPELLAYLNRHADQRAELVTQVDDITPTPAVGRDGERARKRRAERLAREAERNQPADQTQALTNSMVDTKSPWPKPNLATGLAPVQPDADQTQPKESPAPEPDEPRQAEATAVSPDSADAPTAPKPFDWGNLLDAAVRKPITPDSPAPLLQPEPGPRVPRVRLTVIIQQAPIDAPAKQD